MSGAKEHVARIIKGKIIFEYPERLMEYLSGYTDGDWVTVSFIQPRRPKTLKQLSYYYAVILPTIHSAMLELGWDTQGVPVCLEQADYYLKVKCGGSQKKRNMSVEEAARFMTNAIQHGTIHFGTTIPEPTQQKETDNG